MHIEQLNTSSVFHAEIAALRTYLNEKELPADLENLEAHLAALVSILVPNEVTVPLLQISYYEQLLEYFNTPEKQINFMELLAAYLNELKIGSFRYDVETGVIIGSRELQQGSELVSQVFTISIDFADNMKLIIAPTAMPTAVAIK